MIIEMQNKKPVRLFDLTQQIICDSEEQRQTLIKEKLETLSKLSWELRNHGLDTSRLAREIKNIQEQVAC